MKMRNLMWSECANMAVQLDNSHIRSHGERNHELHYGKESKILKELGGFGDVEVIKEDNNIKGKLSNKVLVVILVVFIMKHGTGTYRILNIKTKGIIYSRIIVWKYKYYG